jgi:hypothetical protein
VSRPADPPPRRHPPRTSRKLVDNTPPTWYVLTTPARRKEDHAHHPGPNPRPAGRLPGAVVTPPDFTPDDVRDARERLYLTRPACCDLLGGQLTVSALARLESKPPRTSTEADIIEELFKRADYTPRARRASEPEVFPAANGSAQAQAAPPPDDSGCWTKAPAFKTLRRGDILRYRGERFRFLARVTAPNGEVYVEAANLHNGGIHSLRPDEVRDRRGRTLPNQQGVLT